jgi:DNA-binding transcriptional ArsR family regulator
MLSTTAIEVLRMDARTPESALQSTRIDPEKVRRAVTISKALAHEVRLSILCLLAGGEKSVSDICLALNLPQVRISQQLARLRRDRLVGTYRVGRTVLYRNSARQLGPILDALTLQAKVP